MPTDNPINPIRNCNPKIHLTNIKINTKAQYKQNHTGPNYVTTYIPKIHLNPNII